MRVACFDARNSCIEPEPTWDDGIRKCSDIWDESVGFHSLLYAAFPFPFKASEELNDLCALELLVFRITFRRLKNGLAWIQDQSSPYLRAEQAFNHDEVVGAKVLGLIYVYGVVDSFQSADGRAVRAGICVDSEFCKVARKNISVSVEVKACSS